MSGSPSRLGSQCLWASLWAWLLYILIFLRVILGSQKSEVKGDFSHVCLPASYLWYSFPCCQHVTGTQRVHSSQLMNLHDGISSQLTLKFILFLHTFYAFWLIIMTCIYHYGFIQNNSHVQDYLCSTYSFLFLLLTQPVMFVCPFWLF